MSGRARGWVLGPVLALTLGACSAPHGAASHSSSPTSSSPPPLSSSTTTTSPTPFDATGASFINAEQGWVFGSVGCHTCPGLKVTTDGGSTWTDLPAPTVPVFGYSQALDAVSDIYFADPDNGFLFGPGLEMTHDGGQSWAAPALPPVMEVTGSGGYAYALARPSTGPARVWRNTIGLNAWSPLSLPPMTGPFQGFQLGVEGHTLLLLQEGETGPIPASDEVGTLWTSDDAGSEWVERRVPCTAEDGGAAVISIAYGHPDAWLVDCFDNEQSSQEQQTQHHLYGTANAGGDWVRLADPSETGAPFLLADNGSGHAFLTTESGGQDWLHATFDGARTWTMLFSRVGFSGWADLQFVDASTGFVVGTGYTSASLYRTDDSGHTWRVLQFTSSSQPHISTTPPPGTSPTTSAPVTAPPSSQALPCNLADLRVTVPGVGVGAGMVRRIDFRNVGATPCKMFGYPGVAGLNGAGEQVTQATRNTQDAAPSVVVLRPSQIASAEVDTDEAPTDLYPCLILAALLVTPPNDFHSAGTVVGSQGDGANEIHACQPLSVSPVVSGAGGVL